MKVVVAVHDSVCPIRGGGALRTLKTAVELKARGFDVVLIAPSEKSEIDGIRCLSLPFIEKGKTGFVGLVAFTIKYILNFLKTYRERKVKLVFVHNAVLGFPTAILKFFLGFKFVQDVTDLHSEYIRYTKRTFAQSAALPLVRWAEYFAFRRAERVIAVTKVMKDMIVKEGGVPLERIEVIYDGVDCKKFEEIFNYKKNNPPPAGNIIYIGSMEETDGIMGFVEALPHIASSEPKAKFIFVGGGGDFEAVIEKIKRQGLYDKCIFTGWVNYEKVMDYLKDASIGLITRPLTPPNHTVITLKLLEYWASGTAVVSTRLKGIEEVSSDGKDIIFYDAGSPRDLADKILQLLSSPHKLKEIAINGYGRAADFEWTVIIKKLADISIGILK